MKRLDAKLAVVVARPALRSYANWMRPTPSASLVRAFAFPVVAVCAGACGSSPAAPPVPQAETGVLSGLTAAHNAEREATGPGLPDLVWDDELAGVAQSWSDKLARDGCPLVHSSGDYGENLFWTSATATPEEVVDAWVSEKLDYTLSPAGPSEQCTAVCGHYTQVVWADTERVGCGVAECMGQTGQVWTCNYDPPGNWVGQTPY